ncbi:hypothetical protein GCM10011492_39120 [Flexivirga endophytica]|uniref:Uncharacterized protein n=1 Tax=Flexivirga endophytica TaxID=1849103 RepID=A0A916TGQ2_9MICO|nr:hypothetical protein [Flexivirga endophytica]GGB44223.1 hypothetical protein GCM10011492_39120 [Flexivirga endophytica]GHB60127.1 hypothetical protein GCM10008112_31320 [Flexivirga endophytica]
MENISTFVWSYFAIAGLGIVALAAVLVTWSVQYVMATRSEATRTTMRRRPVVVHHRHFALHH